MVEELAVKQWCLHLARGHGVMLTAVSSRGMYVVVLAVEGDLVDRKGTIRDTRENHDGTIGQP